MMGLCLQVMCRLRSRAWSCAYLTTKLGGAGVASSHASSSLWSLLLSPTDLPSPLPPSLMPYLPPSPSSGGASHVWSGSTVW